MNDSIKWIREYVLSHKKNDITYIAAATLIVAVAVVLLITAKFWLPYLLVLVVLAYFAYDKLVPQKPQPQSLNNTVYVVYQCMFTIINEMVQGNRLPMVQPLIDMEDIHTIPEITYKNNLPFIKLCLPKKIGYTVESDTNKILKKILQSRINSRLRTASVEGVTCASHNGVVPIITIDEVKNEGLYWVLDIGFCDNSAMVDYFMQKQKSILQKSNAIPKDRDF